MNNRAQMIAEQKGYYDGIKGLHNRNPYLPKTKKGSRNYCYDRYQDGYIAGQKAKQARAALA